MSVIMKIVMPYHGDISVNRYLARSKNGVYVRDVPKVWGMVLRGAINSILPKGYNPDWLIKDNPFSLDIAVMFPRRFSTRSGDAGNFDKFPRDIVASALGVDDAGTGGTQNSTYGNGDESKIALKILLNMRGTFLGGDDRVICLV